jgi:hypothetical protein
MNLGYDVKSTRLEEKKKKKRKKERTRGGRKGYIDVVPLTVDRLRDELMNQFNSSIEERCAALCAGTSSDRSTCIIMCSPQWSSDPSRGDTTPTLWVGVHYIQQGHSALVRGTSAN